MKRDLSLFLLSLLVLAWVLWCIAHSFVADVPATSRVGDWCRPWNPHPHGYFAPLVRSGSDVSARPNLNPAEQAAWERAVRKAQGAR